MKDEFEKLRLTRRELLAAAGCLCLGSGVGAAATPRFVLEWGRKGAGNGCRGSIMSRHNEAGHCEPPNRTTDPNLE